MPQDRTPQLSFNLSRRLISIFLVSVLAVYTAGITVLLIENDTCSEYNKIIRSALVFVRNDRDGRGAEHTTTCCFPVCPQPNQKEGPL